MRLCAQPLNHIKTDQLGDCVGRDPESCENGSTLGMKVVMSGCVGHGSRYLLVKVTHPLKSYPMAKAIVLGFIL